MSTISTMHGLSASSTAVSATAVSTTTIMFVVSEWDSDLILKIKRGEFRMIKNGVILFLFALFSSGCLEKQPQQVKSNHVNPYERIIQQEKFQALTNYLVKKSLEPSKPNFPAKPKEPTIPQAQELVKGKYEKLADFEARVEVERKKELL